MPIFYSIARKFKRMILFCNYDTFLSIYISYLLYPMRYSTVTDLAKLRG